MSSLKAETTQTLNPTIASGAHPPTPLHDLRFPVEIWRQIFQHASVSDLASVAYAALVCSTLHAAAEDVLYHHVELWRTQSARQFRDAILRCPGRAHIVRTLVLGWTSQAELVETERDLEPHFDVMRFILARLPALHTITLRRDYACVLSLPKLVDALVPTLRHLTGDEVESTADMHALLAARPELEEVRLRWDRRTPYTTQTLAGRNLSNLCKLVCPAKMLEGARFTPNLTHLYVTVAYGQDHLLEIIELVGEHLVSLRICRRFDGYTRHDRPTSQRYDWSGCLKLKFLQIHDELADRFFPQGIPAVDLEGDFEFASCPPSLVTFVWSPPWGPRSGW
ncbi:hypothetical protein C8Q74DRAFT_332014 [Fomes fomentarius]|nr:hypothetical protein C8Q74DRAFT_332014 [Fomes fomentarius]